MAICLLLHKLCSLSPFFKLYMSGVQDPRQYPLNFLLFSLINITAASHPLPHAKKFVDFFFFFCGGHGGGCLWNLSIETELQLHSLQTYNYNTLFSELLGTALEDVNYISPASVRFPQSRRSDDCLESHLSSSAVGR